MPRGHRRGMCVLTLATLAWAGCGGGDTEVKVDQAPGASSSIRSGGVLPNGFVVAKGSTLIGAALPDVGTNPLDGAPMVEGWTAHLMVDGKAEDVVNDYVVQAEARGLQHKPPLPSVDIHGKPIDIGAPGHTWTRCAGSLNGDFRCYASLRSPDRTDPRTLSILIRRGGPPEKPLSHGVLTYATTDRAWDSPAPGAYGDPNATDPGAPRTWPKMPSAGESFASEWGTLGDVTVEPGSAVAGPPSHLDVDSRSAQVVLEVTDDPAAVLEAYRNQLADVVGACCVGDVERLVAEADITVDRLVADEVGGRDFQLHLVQRPGERTWMMIETGYD